MPVKVEQRGTRYVVVDPSGHVYGEHNTREKAEKQREAIEINKHKKGK